MGRVTDQGRFDMALRLSSSFSALDTYLRAFDAGQQMVPKEFLLLRSDADVHLSRVTEIATGAFRQAADTLVETMQACALEARKKHLSAEQREVLKEAVEHQLGYVIAGYQSTLQRL